MERRTEDFHARDPHPDGRKESIINDSTASAGEQMGVRVDLNPENFDHPKNPFHIQPKQDKELEKFSKFFDGKIDENHQQ